MNRWWPGVKLMNTYPSFGPLFQWINVCLWRTPRAAQRKWKKNSCCSVLLGGCWSLLVCVSWASRPTHQRFVDQQMTGEQIPRDQCLIPVHRSFGLTFSWFIFDWARARWTIHEQHLYGYRNLMTWRPLAGESSIVTWFSWASGRILVLQVISLLSHER